MADQDLEPKNVMKMLGTLALAQALLSDVSRGRSISAPEVAQIRDGFTAVRRVLDALDVLNAWNAVPDMAGVIKAGDNLIDENSTPGHLTKWHAATDPWRE